MSTYYEKEGDVHTYPINTGDIILHEYPKVPSHKEAGFIHEYLIAERAFLCLPDPEDHTEAKRNEDFWCVITPRLAKQDEVLCQTTTRETYLGEAVA
jgi:hypothetical protein